MLLSLRSLVRFLLRVINLLQYLTLTLETPHAKPTFATLPTEIHFLIFECLKMFDAAHLAGVNQHFFSIFRSTHKVSTYRAEIPVYPLNEFEAELRKRRASLPFEDLDEVFWDSYWALLFGILLDLIPEQITQRDCRIWFDRWHESLQKPIYVHFKAKYGGSRLLGEEGEVTVEEERKFMAEAKWKKNAKSLVSRFKTKVGCSVQ